MSTCPHRIDGERIAARMFGFSFALLVFRLFPELRDEREQNFRAAFWRQAMESDD